jgi:predicted nucleic acid-binding protein
VIDPLIYLDSSALVKLVFDEAESEALLEFVARWPRRVSSTLARVEVLRVAGSVGDPAVEREANRVMRAITLVRMDDIVLRAAASLRPASLRTLDAIHLATAQLFESQLAGFVVYDRRLAAAARQHGLTVYSPTPA